MTNECVQSRRRTKSENSYRGIDPVIVRLVKNAASRAIGKAGFREHDLPDIEQELMLAVFNGLEKSDPAVGSPVTLARHIVERRMKNLITRRFSPCRDWRRCDTSLNEEIVFDDDNGETAELLEMVDNEQRLRLETPHERAEEFSDYLNLKMDVEQMCSRLPVRQRKICEILQLETRRGTAECLNISRDEVDSTLENLTAFLLESGNFR